ncbi:unnamed protein product [Dracunculus medinensis]|uniref:non-specific serine/threonine protein kinase n=1 Tax=Dracunculus medinensis TaxID=318479 RepID=A0A0N4ULK3_DRAME|nr:unnamed protein product [Dracunculus medinensis]
MSLKRFATLALHFTEVLLYKFGKYSASSRISLLPIVKANLRKNVGLTEFTQNKYTLTRLFRSILRGLNSRMFIRPFSTVDHNKVRFSNGRINRHYFIVIKRKPYTVFDKIKHLFSTHERFNRTLLGADLPDRLDGYDIGSNIACGCNAAIYELRVKEPILNIRRSNAPLENHEFPSTSNFSRDYSVGARLKAYPLALKIMFNYDFDLPEHYLWLDMCNELIPLDDAKHLLRDRFINLRTLPHCHPNIVKMYKAFIDRMPIFEEAQNLYPEALPTATFHGNTLLEPRTMFIIMKRYRMTLREYILTRKRNYWTGRVLFGQLLEAIVFLFDNQISHRDMKSDNILLDFDCDSDIPHLVLSDFGCALATGSFLVNYTNDEVNLGGNLSLRAPEVRRAVPGIGHFVNFSMADLWAAGTIGYEIFTRMNPFYKQMKSYDYMEFELPQLPRRIHYAVKMIIREMLRIDPQKRPKPHVAANLICLSLFRFGEDFKQYLIGSGIDFLFSTEGISKLGHLEQGTGDKIRLFERKIMENLNDVMLLYASETILAKNLEGVAISQAEIQLRSTFLSRLDYEDVWSAIAYFYVDEEKIH